MTVPDFGPTNMSGNRYFDQMAFTTKGKAGRKARLLRHGTFDWRHAVFGPHPKVVAMEFTVMQNELGMSRIDRDGLLANYKDIVTEARAKHKKEPYSEWAKSYKNWTTFEMSDHLPIWMELEVDYSDDYLRRYLK